VRLGFAVRSVCKKYFGIDADYVGYVNHDEAVTHAIRQRRPVVVTHPNSDASVYLVRIARKLLDASRKRGPRPPAARTHATPVHARRPTA
jgi:MinD-like ATPase involved in chromosome partitioning or flagellar assembly